MLLVSSADCCLGAQMEPLDQPGMALYSTTWPQLALHLPWPHSDLLADDVPAARAVRKQGAVAVESQASGPFIEIESPTSSRRPSESPGGRPSFKCQVGPDSVDLDLSLPKAEAGQTFCTWRACCLPTAGEA